MSLRSASGRHKTLTPKDQNHFLNDIITSWPFGYNLVLKREINSNPGVEGTGVFSWGAHSFAAGRQRSVQGSRPEVSSNAAFNLTLSLQCPHSTSTLNFLVWGEAGNCTLYSQHSKADTGWTVVAHTINLSTQEAQARRSL